MLRGLHASAAKIQVSQLREHPTIFYAATDNTRFLKASTQELGLLDCLHCVSKTDYFPIASHFTHTYSSHTFLQIHPYLHPSLCPLCCLCSGRHYSGTLGTCSGPQRAPVLYYCRKNSDYRSGLCIANFSILLTCCIQLYYVVVNFAIS